MSERLPDNPLLVVPIEKNGRYGGTIRHALMADSVRTAGFNKSLSEGVMGYYRPLPTHIGYILAEHDFAADGLAEMWIVYCRARPRFS